MKNNKRQSKNLVNSNIKRTKHSKGITLVALVITIIVLIILAGVSINLVLGENGVFKRAIEARELYEKSSKEEQEEINQFLDSMDLALYVQNGLLVQYDALNNTGSGHDSKATTWKNLAQNDSYDAQIHGASVESNCISLDGIDDWIGIGQVDTNSPLTLETTIKFNDFLAGQNKFISNTQVGGIAVWVEKNKLCLCIGRKTEESASNNYINLNIPVDILQKTVHVAITFDGTSVKVYMNGEKKGEVPFIGIYVEPQENTIMTLGAEPYGEKASSGYSNMNIYSCRIYKNALTEEEIKNNYQLDKQRYIDEK